MAQASAARRPGVNVFDESRPMWRLLLVFLVPLILSNVLQSASQTMAQHLDRPLDFDAGAGRRVGRFPNHLLALLVRFRRIERQQRLDRPGVRRARPSQGEEDRRDGSRRRALPRHRRCDSRIARFSPTILSLLATPADIIGQADAYAKVIFLTMPVFFVYFVYATILRGTGDSTTPFYALIVSAVLAIVITPLFIVGWFGLPKLGVVSAAVAGLIANASALVWLLIYLARRDHPLKLDRETLSDMRIDWKILGAVLRIGIPTALQVMMVSLAEIAVISFVNRFGSQGHGGVRRGEPSRQLRPVPGHLDRHSRIDFRRPMHRRAA